MSKAIVASGTIAVLDLNDAIISGEAPSNPIKGTLWIDTSKNPNVLYMWNGSSWIKQHFSVGDLDPDFKEEVEDLKNQLESISNDGIISSGEKLSIKLLLVEITGQNVTGTSLPTLAQIDTKAGGQVYMARTAAKEAGVPTNHTSYTEFEAAYNSLKSYLESLSPRPWLDGDTNIDPSIWLTKWNTYYEKLAKLQVTTNEYLNNSLKPGEDYNGTTITEEEGIVVLRGDKLVKTSLNATDGIAIRRRPNTSSAWTDMFYVDTNGYLNAKGLKISSDSTLGSSSVSNVVNNAAAGAQAKEDIDNLEIGGRNLIKGTKNFTLEVKGSSTDTGHDREGWKNTGGWTFAKDSEGFTVASKSQTDQTSNNISSLYSTKYPVKVGDEIILSCYVKVDDVTVWDGNKAPYIFEIFNASGTRVEYQDVGITLSNTNKPTPVSGEWFHFYSTHKVTHADAATVGMRATLFRNGSIHIKKCKVEFGNFKPTDWSPAPEDTDNRIGVVVDEEGNIKTEEIAYGFSVNTDAAQIISQVIDLTGKVSFGSYVSAVKDDSGNPITNADQPDYDANFPKWLGSDGNYYRPYEFVDGVYIQEGDKTVINGASIATGSVQADKINFKNAVVEKEIYNSSGNLVSTEKTFEIKADGSVFSAGTFQSLDYEPQTRGWIISETGEAEFNNAYFRGDVLLPNAGITSATDSSASTEEQNNQVRIWAGTSFDKKEEASFRVTHDGSLYATKGHFEGLFNGTVEVGNIRIADDSSKTGDAIITIADHSGTNKVSIGESAAEFKTPAYFGTTSGRFLTIDSTNQRLDFGKSDFQLDYKNNKILMKSYSITGGSDGLIFNSTGSSEYDFKFTTTDGNSHVLADNLHINQNIEYEDIVTMRRVNDSGNPGVDFVFF